MTRKPNRNHVFIRELFPIASSIYNGKQLQTVDDDTWERHYRSIMGEDPKQVRRQPNTKVDYNTWERNFRAAMEGV